MSSQRYCSRRAQRDEPVRRRLIELAQEHPRYGSPRLCVLLNRESRCNHKRVERLYREAGLSLRRKKRKRLVRHHISTAPAQAANQEWALDFVTDALASDRHLRVLTVVDVFTRQCLALETDTSLGSLRVIRVLEQIIAEHGAPQRIRSDNGPEFTSRAYLAWALERRIELLHIRPGKPIENAYIESFNGRLREECLNVSWFRNLFDARRQIAGLAQALQPVASAQQSGLSYARRVCGASSRRRSLQCWCGERCLKRRPLSPRPYPRSIGRDQPELSYARLNGFGGKVTMIHTKSSIPHDQ